MAEAVRAGEVSTFPALIYYSELKGQARNFFSLFLMELFLMD
jgi:hypothetical protein